MDREDVKKELRRHREIIAQQKAAEKNKPVIYIDDDGCEVTVTPSGHVFFNAADWW